MPIFPDDVQNQYTNVGNRILYSRDENLPFSEAVLIGNGEKLRKLYVHFLNLGVRIANCYSLYAEDIGGEVYHHKILHLSKMTKREKGLPCVVAYRTGINCDWSPWLARLGVTNAYFDFRAEGARFIPSLLGSYGKQIAAVAGMMADQASLETYLSVVKSVARGDDGFLKVSPFRQYWHPEVAPAKGDVILDLGALGGETAIDFCMHLDRECRVVSLEPSDETHEKLLSQIKGAGLERHVTPVKLGAWSCRKTCMFKHFKDVPGASRISDSGDIKIEVIDMDTLAKELNLSKVSLIKMDIEGAELDALKGALEIMKTMRPKLHISLYHRVEDLWELPLFIQEHLPGYRYYLGHHTASFTETTLYAKPE